MALTDAGYADRGDPSAPPKFLRSGTRRGFSLDTSSVVLDLDSDLSERNEPEWGLEGLAVRAVCEPAP